MSFELSFQKSFDASFAWSFEASDVRSNALSLETSDARSDVTSIEMSNGMSDEVGLRMSLLGSFDRSFQRNSEGSFQRSFELRVSSEAHSRPRSYPSWQLWSMTEPQAPMTIQTRTTQCSLTRTTIGAPPDSDRKPLICQSPSANSFATSSLNSASPTLSARPEACQPTSPAVSSRNIWTRLRSVTPSRRE